MAPLKTPIISGILIFWISFGSNRAIETNPDFRSLDIKMVNASKLFGSFLLTHDVAIPAEDGVHSYLTDTYHDCRMMCWTFVNCSSLSLQPEGTRFRCIISDQGPLEYTLMPFIGAKYIVLMTAFSPSPWRLLPDVVTLAMIPVIPGSYPDALQNCRRIPGFDLGVFITEKELQSVKTLGVQAATAVSGATGLTCGWINNFGNEDSPRQLYYDPSRGGAILGSIDYICGPVCVANVT